MGVDDATAEPIRTVAHLSALAAAQQLGFEQRLTWQPPFGANAGFPAPTAQPVLAPWNNPRSAIFAQTPWVPMTPPPPIAPPSAFPSALPHSALKTRVNALLEHLNSGKYWPVAPAPSGANEQPPSRGFDFPPVPQQAPSWVFDLLGR